MANDQSVSKLDIITTSFLVGGTCIGGGMLGLPVGSSLSGFFPSTLMLLVCWVFMTISGLLILEVNLWMDKGAHIITMASKMLGPWGKGFAWVLYLFIGYASLVAYMAGGGGQINQLMELALGARPEKWIGCLVFAVGAGSVIFFGGKLVGRVNTILFTAMIASYGILVFLGSSEIKFDLLARKDWGRSMFSIPILLTAFSFQTIVPSLTPVLNGNAKWLRFSIVFGTTISLCVYLLWQAIVLGTVPMDGPHGLAEAYVEGNPATCCLVYTAESAWLSSIAGFFAFFALVTSFLGIALGLFDFLADGLKIEKKGLGNVALGLLVAVPSLYFAISYSRAFLVAMEISGGFGDAILNGIMPVMMIWVGRYRKGLQSEYRCPGGKPLLVLVFLFYLFVCGLEFWEQIGGLHFYSAD
ncbi:MAG: tyrosine-specific transport protein [Chlamydiales bacterium]|jgi:tyrosine-specific transport protein